MAEAFLALSRIDQAEVLELARARSGRPAHLLEKDVWVVWALAALFDSPLAQHLTFKGGTSLSKAYKLIDRFSEDIDLSCDIRSLIPDLLARDAALPTTRSQANKWTKAVRERLPQWLATDVNPVLEAALAREHLQAGLEIGGADHASVLLHYPATTRGSGYVRPTLTLEFGGRATGEPRQPLQVNCDMDGLVEGVAFPSARPWVMGLARTFWEKATAAHVYCAQARVHGERYARHWHDLAAIARGADISAIVADRVVAKAVAEHKSCFFAEKDSAGDWVDYFAATQGALRLAPQGQARDALAADYAAMLADGVMVGDAIAFEELMTACEHIAGLANGGVRRPPTTASIDIAKPETSPSG